MKRIVYTCEYVYDSGEFRGEVMMTTRVAVFARNQTSGIKKAATIAARRCPDTCVLSRVEFSEVGWS